MKQAIQMLFSSILLIGTLQGCKKSSLGNGSSSSGGSGSGSGCNTNYSGSFTCTISGATWQASCVALLDTTIVSNVTVSTLEIVGYGNNGTTHLYVTIYNFNHSTGVYTSVGLSPNIAELMYNNDFYFGVATARVTAYSSTKAGGTIDDMVMKDTNGNSVTITNASFSITKN